MVALAEIIVASLAHRHPDACRDALNDVRSNLSEVEEDIGVVPTRRIALARNYLVGDALNHQWLYQKLPEQGVLFYDDHGGRVGDST